MEGGRKEKREIVTTELVAGADFFHHLPCAAGGQHLEDWERVRVKPRPQQPHTLHKVVKQHFEVKLPKNILTQITTCHTVHSETKANRRCFQCRDVFQTYFQEHVWWCIRCVICMLHSEKRRAQMPRHRAAISTHMNNWVKVLSLTRPQYVGNLLRKCRHHPQACLVDSYCSRNKLCNKINSALLSCQQWC